MKKNKRRGSALLEFAFTGVPTIFLTLSVFEAGLTMWQYHTLAQTVQITARYAITHGATCQSNTGCGITVGDITSYVRSNAVGLDPAKLNLKLYTGSSLGNQINCAPLTNCDGSSTTFPPVADAAIGNDVQVVATYSFSNPIVMFWPGKSKVSEGALTLGATSTQRILF